MFILFSPYSFFFFSTYLLFLFSLFTISNFYYYWLIMEIIILLFIGLSYTLFISSYSQLMVYFLIQAISSFLILVFYIYSIPVFITFAILMKLSMFPFFMWYINVIYRFPNFIFWVARTVHKIPVMVIIKSFCVSIDMSVLWVSIILTTLIRGIIILSVLDFRIVLVLSSVGNNSWFILSQITNTFVFLAFILIYSFSLFYILSRFKNMSKPSSVSSFYSSSYTVRFWVLSLSGMPPFPVFYVKILIIVRLLITIEINFLFFIFLVSNSLIVIGYLQSIIKYFIYSYSSNAYYLLKY